MAKMRRSLYHAVGLSVNGTILIFFLFDVQKEDMLR